MSNRNSKIKFEDNVLTIKNVQYNLETVILRAAALLEQKPGPHPDDICKLFMTEKGRYVFYSLFHKESAKHGVDIRLIHAESLEELRNKVHLAFKPMVDEAGRVVGEQTWRPRVLDL